MGQAITLALVRVGLRHQAGTLVYDRYNGWL
jgi:hypothetical protein